MIRPSRRYVAPVILLLVVASVPATLRALHPRHLDPCAAADALRELEAVPGTRPENENLAHLDLERIQWSEGMVLDEDGEETSLRFQLVRDFDGRRFFVRPFQVAASEMEPETQSSHRIDTAAGPIEIHRAVDGARRFTHGASQVASWTFLYGNEPVGSPLWAKVRHAVTELKEGRRPLSLLVVYGSLSPARMEALLDRSDAWLRDAVEYYVATCSPS